MPETKAPGNKPATPYGPKKIPTNNGVAITKIPGFIISLNDAFVEILIQAA